MNGIDVIRTDISPEVLNRDSRVKDLRKLSVDDLVSILKEADCVLFASVLFAYSELSSELKSILEAIKKAKPKYILYEDSHLNFSYFVSSYWTEVFSTWGYSQLDILNLDPAVETFYENKSIRRHGSYTVLLKHFNSE
jgi:hypothetical protein